MFLKEPFTRMIIILKPVKEDGREAGLDIDMDISLGLIASEFLM